MIIEHTPEGEIRHIVMDPVPNGVADAMRAAGVTFIELPPVPMPDIPALDADGNPIIDRETKPLLNEDGTPQVNDDGEPLFQVIDTPRMVTGRTHPVQADIMRDYIDNGMLAPRPSLGLPETLDLKLGESRRITALPDPFTLTFEGQSQIVTGGELELTADMIAHYTILIRAWPYLPAEIKVNVHEA